MGVFYLMCWRRNYPQATGTRPMNQGAAQAPDVSFSLTLPTRPDGARAIATLEAVVIAMGAHLTYAKGDATGLLDAAWDPATAITGHLRYKDVGPPPARELSIRVVPQ